MSAQAAPLPTQVDEAAALQRGAICIQCTFDVPLCKCSGKTPGHDVAFMCNDALPESASVHQHLQRFVEEAEAHPVLCGEMAMRQLVNDHLAKGLPRVLEVRRGDLEDMVRAYMAKPEYDQLVTTLATDKATVDEDCEDLLQNWFKGAWYYLSRLQLLLFMNAFQLSDKQRFKPTDGELMMVFDVLMALHVALKAVSGSMVYCLEMRAE